MRICTQEVYYDSKGRIWIGNNGIGVLLEKKTNTFRVNGPHSKE
jgi:hypothetical protein